MAWNPVANIKGDTGLSAYDIAVENGFSGTEGEWLVSLIGTANWCGEWLVDESGDYLIGDIVSRNGSSYVCVIDHTSGDPELFPSRWYLIASRGYQGATGAQGTQGVQGATGTGSQGSAGSQGAQGSAGSTGSQGLGGAQGATGPQGAQGIQGSQGSIGSMGTQGATGPQGIQGSQGSAGSQGSIGSQGVQGFQGAQGSTGSVGSQGIVGIQGATGSQGAMGLQGQVGAQGQAGSIGGQGYQGGIGAQGATGPQGTQGNPASTGLLLPAQHLCDGTETFTISAGSVTKIAGNSSGLTIQWQTVSVGDRVLVISAPASSGVGSEYTYTTQPANGIYVVTAKNASDLSVSRASDMSGAVNPHGLSVYMENPYAGWGARSIFSVSNPSAPGSFAYGTSNIKFGYTAGSNLNVSSIYVGDSGKIGWWNNTPGISSYLNINPATPSGADQNLTLPAVTTDTLLSRTSIDTLTGKSISGASNTLSSIPMGALAASGTPGSGNFLCGNGSWKELDSATVGPNFYKASYQSGNYYFMGAVGGNTYAQVANEARVFPFVLTEAITIVRLVLTLVAAASSTAVYRIGVWNHDPATGKPSTLVLDAGTVNVGNGVSPGLIELTVSLALNPGIYWFGGALQNNAGTVPVIASQIPSGTSTFAHLIPLGTSVPTSNQQVYAFGFYQSGVTGAFGDFSVTGPLTRVDSGNGSPPRLIMKVA